MVRCQVGAELRRAAHLGAVDDDDLDVEGGDERRELGEGGDRHPDHRRLLERGELELRVEARLLAARGLILLAEPAQLDVHSLKLRVHPQPAQLLALVRIERPQLVVFTEALLQREGTCG